MRSNGDELRVSIHHGDGRYGTTGNVVPFLNLQTLHDEKVQNELRITLTDHFEPFQPRKY